MKTLSRSISAQFARTLRLPQTVLGILLLGSVPILVPAQAFQITSRFQEISESQVLIRTSADFIWSPVSWTLEGTYPSSPGLVLNLGPTGGHISTPSIFNNNNWQSSGTVFFNAANPTLGQVSWANYGDDFSINWYADTGTFFLQLPIGVTSGDRVIFDIEFVVNGTFQSIFGTSNPFASGDILVWESSDHASRFFFSAVPEPNSWALGAFGAIVLALRWMRRPMKERAPHQKTISA